MEQAGGGINASSADLISGHIVEYNTAQTVSGAPGIAVDQQQSQQHDVTAILSSTVQQQHSDVTITIPSTARRPSSASTEDSGNCSLSPQSTTAVPDVLAQVMLASNLPAMVYAPNPIATHQASLPQSTASQNTPHAAASNARPEKSYPELIAEAIRS